jgi:hypothetical protein
MVPFNRERIPSLAVEVRLLEVVGLRVSLGTTEFYRLYAARCIEIARQMMDSENKATLLAMAQMWLGLADQAEKNAHIPTILYETPGPKEEVSST